MQAGTEAEATVIIPSYNQKRHIFDALNSVLMQETDFSFEVIVVDSSPNDTAELVREKFPNIKVIKLPRRAFPGAARNVAIKEAKGRYLAFTDTDCVVDRHWLQRLVESHRQGYRVVGGMVRNGTPFSVTGTLDYLLEFSDLLTPWKTTKKTHFGTGNVSLDRQVFADHGLFADQVKGSDSLYTRQLKQKGETLFNQPEAIIWHRNRTNLRRIFRNQYELGFGAAMSREKFAQKGKILLRHPWLIPFLPLFKIAAIAGRLLRYSPTNFLKFVILSPLALIVLSVFAVGFAKGRRAALERKS